MKLEIPRLSWPLLNKERQQLGLALSDSTLRTTLISTNKWCHNIEVRSWARQDRALVDSFEAVSKDFEYNGKTVIGLPLSYVKYQATRISQKLNEAEILQYIHHHAEDFFGLPESELYVDYLRQRSPILNETEVLLHVIATPRDRIERIRTATQQAGLKLQAIEITSFVLVRLFMNLKMDEPYVALLLYQDTNVDVALFHENELIYADTFKDDDNIQSTVLAAINRQFPHVKNPKVLTCGKPGDSVNTPTALNDPPLFTTHTAGSAALALRGSR